MDNVLVCNYGQFFYKQPFNFSTHSTIGVGGFAPIAFYPSTEKELLSLLLKLSEEDREYVVVGNLSNLLPPDNGLEKAVICTKRLVDSQMGKRCYLSAGISAGALLRICRYAKKSGGEFLTGIPCTLGGALYMNAGVCGKYIAELVEEVRVVREGEIIWLSQTECEYAYKKSVFMRNKDIILGARLSFTDSDEKRIQILQKEYAQRRVGLPKGKSMGCIFKNPSDKSAGAYIEQCGLKGVRIGGAHIAREHANFIINDGNATEKDIRALIALMKEKVLLEHGIRLEEEIGYL